MLLDNLCTVEHVETAEGIIRANLRLNTAHPIFAGHFPGRPILPGACQVQLVRELLSYTTAKDCRLLLAAQIKFLTMIDPREHETVDLTLHYGPHAIAPRPELTAPDASAAEKWQVSATGIAGKTVFLKFNGIFAAG